MRPDGTRVRDLTAIMQALPYVMPKRYDAQNWAEEYLDEDAIRDYIRAKRREGRTVTHMSLLVSAYYRAVLKNPKINYFVMNRRIYKRNHFCFSFVILKTRADGTPDETSLKVYLEPEDTVFTVTEKIRSHPNITVVPGEVTAIPEGNVIIASGPLTSDALAAAIAEKLGEGHTLNFFDAAAPLVTFESIDMDSAFFASRYDKGTPDYINCPMSEEEYETFWQALTTAEEAEVHGFED